MQQDLQDSSRSNAFMGDKRILLWVLLLFTLFIGVAVYVNDFSKRVTNAEDLRQIEGRFYKKAENEPYTGVVEVHYENGSIKEHADIKEGLQDGDMQAWYENGKPKEKGSYSEGKRDGLFVRWYPNGVKSFEGKYQVGKKEGLAREWYKSGKKRVSSTT